MSPTFNRWLENLNTKCSWLAYNLNKSLRKFDFGLHRTFGGEARPYVTRAPGYPLSITLLGTAASTLIVCGPTPALGWYTALIFAAFYLWYFLLSVFLPGWDFLRLQIATFLVSAAAVAYFGYDKREANGGLYWHDSMFFVPLLMIIVCVVANCLARRLVNGFRERYVDGWMHPDALLRKKELFVTPAKESDYSGWRFFRSFFNTPFRHMLLSLYAPALFILLAPKLWITWYYVGAIFLAVMGIMALAGVQKRLETALDVIERGLFRGMLYAASLLVIVIAIARMADISYVTVFLDGTGSLTVTWFLGACYVTLWLYEMWVGYILSKNLLSLLHPAGDRVTEIDYPIDDDTPSKADVSKDERYVRVHGTRFIVTGKFPRDKPPIGEAWEFYDRTQLFAELASTDPSKGDPKAFERRFGLEDLFQRVQFYFVVMHGILVGGCAAVYFYVDYMNVHHPVREIRVDLPKASDYDLHKEIFDKGRKRVVLVAASGGGTRAALYTASLFQGLTESGAMEDVVLCSGVSGGSAAIAYHTLHESALKSDAPLEWEKYARVMSASYIDDVLRGGFEMRMLNGNRSGLLLAESFHRHMLPAPADNKLGKAGRGLIFNTTLAGSGQRKGDGLDPANPIVAGGRLVFTNLAIPDGFPNQGPEGAETEYLKYVILNDPDADLTTAAALSANFPPVFSNAAVDVFENDVHMYRHWVTDGGASDNRGAISLLYALNEALAIENKGKKRPPPRIHVVIADASALSLDYSQDRGIGSTFGAAEKYGNQLTVELVAKCNRSLEALWLKERADWKEDAKTQKFKSPMKVHFLPMPSIFRARGGISTHWMLPAYVTLKTTVAEEKGTRDVTKNINGTEARDLIMDLHRSCKTTETSLNDVWGWLKEDRHTTNWKTLREQLESK